jgi:hypothetical protein
MSGNRFYQLFRPGAYKQGNYSESFVQQLVQNYDPAFCKAPITAHHAQSGFALGWVEAVKFEDGLLKGSFERLAPELVAFVQDGKLGPISIEVFKDLPGKGPYLKAVSFLGAEIPAVKGLEPVTFKEGDTETLLFNMEAENLAQELARVKAELEAAQVKATEATAKFEEVSAEKQQAQDNLDRLYLTQRRNEFATYLNERVAYGTLKPKYTATCQQLLEALDSVAQFSDGKKPVEAFQEFLKDMPKFLDGGEFATHDDHGGQAGGDTAEFSDMAVDTERMQLHKKAMRLVETEKIPYTEALTKAKKER